MSGGSDEATLRAECEAMGACACCILRFRGVPSGEVDEYRAAASASKDEPPCPCCLGILQLDLDASTAREREGADGAEASAPNGEDDATKGTAAADARNRSDVLVRVDPPAVHARCVSQYAAGIRAGGHEFDVFALEVTLPPALAVRQAATRCHLLDAFARAERKRSADGGDDGGDGTRRLDVPAGPAANVQLPKTTDVKDVLRALLVPALVDASSPPARRRHDQAADFRFALLFEHDLSATEAAFAYQDPDESRGGGGGGRGRGGGGGGGGGGAHNKRRRAPPPHLVGSVFVPAESPAGAWQNHGERYNHAERVAAGELTDITTVARWRSDGRARVTTPPGAPEVCATVRMLTWRQPVYVGGRYLKRARGVPQAPWIDSETGFTIGEGSVQTSLDAVVSRAFRADGSKLNAAGREDIDVRMLGGGRPFILEVHNPRRPNAAATAEARAAMEAAMEAADGGAVAAVDIHVTDAAAYRAMHEASEEKEKEYTALCWAEKPLTLEDELRLSGIKDLQIQQSTPVRVLHRRTSMTRPRTIVSCRCERVPNATRFFTLRLKTQAGTYVKEFVHGDFGRTRPNVGEMLGCAADIMQLDVTDVVMDFANGELKGVDGEREAKRGAKVE